MEARPPLAHSPNLAGNSHLLLDHLTAVARLAERFADRFDSAQFSYAAGLWHDLGKNAADFQAMLDKDPDAAIKDQPGPKPRVDHSSAGALYALDQFGVGIGLPVAFAIAGHHAGLADQIDLDARLKMKEGRLIEAKRPTDAVIVHAPKPSMPAFLQQPGREGNEQKRRYEFWVRMLFSCLVDADFLDTEQHFEGGKGSAEKRSTKRGQYPPAAELRAMLDRELAKFGDQTGQVNKVRAQVLADCREKGRAASQGVFSLTAPTGSGKTLAGMAFALEHADAKGLDRVIVVLPYTSIIDQNAKVYRDVFGAENVIEHHASLDPMKETTRNRVACENWDAPIVITTSVQFLESLLANRPSKCRKLHNIANSVVIFDEVQTLPIAHLLPILDVLRELVQAYRVSLVLSTATQPTLKYRQSGLSQVFRGFEAITE